MLCGQVDDEATSAATRANAQEKMLGLRTASVAFCADQIIKSDPMCLRLMLRRLSGTVRRLQQRSLQPQNLADFDEHLLRDIGVTREQAQREAKRPIIMGHIAPSRYLTIYIARMPL